MFFNVPVLIQVVGLNFIILAAAMAPSMAVSILYGEEKTVYAFLAVILTSLLVGLTVFLTAKPKNKVLRIRDGYLIVALCWVMGSVIGAFPFLLSGAVGDFPTAFFETASGFTTTGSTALSDVEIIPKGILFWRSFTHWIGGMGILIFAIAILPALGIGGQELARAEAPGPTLDKVQPKISDSARLLYLIYAFFTLAEILMLVFGGMSFFDACIHTFGSVGTGGFSNYNTGIMHYDNLYFEVVITFFMFLCGTNFNLHYLFLQKKWNDILHDSEWKGYLLILGGAVFLITMNLWLTGYYDSPWQSLRHAMFNSTSVMTTTGFASADFDLWPTASKIILFLLMFVGASSGSTAGGMKVIRIVVANKLVGRGIYRRLHPQAVLPVKLNKENVSSDVVSKITSFLFLYLMIFFLGTLILSLENYDLITAAASTLACLSNVGPGFALTGPMYNFSFFSDWAKIFLGFLMIIGRLELFTILILFTPSFWNPK